jgi:hypothetical protein
MSDPKIIEAEQIVLRDAAGNTRIFLDALSEAGPRVVLHSGDGKMAVELRGFPGNNGVAPILRAPRRHIIVRLDEERSVISLTDGEGKHSVEIEAPLGAGAGNVQIYRDGEALATLPAQKPNQRPDPTRSPRGPSETLGETK